MAICKASVGMAPSLVTQPSSAGTSKTKSQYFVKDCDNQSKKWDGKVVSLDEKTSEEWFDKDELRVGSKIQIPWCHEGQDESSLFISD